MEPTASTSTSTGTEGYKVVGTSTSTKSKRDSLDVLMGRIPATRPTTPNLRCCCGRTDCVFLKHNCAALDDLEKQVQTTAQLGQVCIPRLPAISTPGLGPVFAFPRESRAAAKLGLGSEK